MPGASERAENPHRTLGTNSDVFVLRYRTRIDRGTEKDGENVRKAHSNDTRRLVATFFKSTFPALKQMCVIRLTLHYNLFININQLDALNFTISLFQASTCFEHMCSLSGGQKLYYTVSGIITLKKVCRLKLLK